MYTSLQVCMPLCPRSPVTQIISRAYGHSILWILWSSCIYPNLQAMFRSKLLRQLSFSGSLSLCFPSMVLARCLTMIIKMRYPTEISLSLTTRGFISSPGAKIFHLVLVEDIGGLKELFSKGLASPNDSFHVDGLSILEVSHSSSVHCYKSRLNSSSLLSLSLICKIYTQIRDKLGPT